MIDIQCKVRWENIEVTGFTDAYCVYSMWQTSMAALAILVCLWVGMSIEQLRFSSYVGMSW